jgi:hypothetical protein
VTIVGGDGRGGIFSGLLESAGESGEGIDEE